MRWKRYAALRQRYHDAALRQRYHDAVLRQRYHGTVVAALSGLGARYRVKLGR